jgi:hypothetical protein
MGYMDTAVKGAAFNAHTPLLAGFIIDLREATVLPFIEDRGSDR